MKIDKNLKKVLVDDYVNDLQSVDLSDEERANMVKVLKSNLAIINECEKTELEKTKISNESKMLEARKVSEEEKIKRQQDLEFEREKTKQMEVEYKDKELEYKKNVLSEEIQRRKELNSIRQQEIKNSSIFGVVTAIGAVGGLIFGKLLPMKFLNDQITKERRLVYKDNGVPTPTMKECRKYEMDMLMKK